MSRNRSARLAVVGTAVQRVAASNRPPRSSPALRRRAVLGALVAVCLVLVTLSFGEGDEGPVGTARDVASAVLLPFQVGAERVVRPFRDAYGYFAALFDAKEENERLREENQRLRQEAIQSRAAIEENESLSALLEYRQSRAFPEDFLPVAAEVTAYPPSQYQQQIVIAAGSSDGIRVDDPVVNADGLVGRVTGVTSTTADVTLLTDERMAVPAETDDAVGLLEHGRAGEESLVLDLVNKRYVVEVGENVVTAGSRRGELGSLYPRGIPIGTVSHVNQSDTDLYKRIQVRPAVDFGSIHSVLVLVPKGERR